MAAVTLLLSNGTPVGFDVAGPVVTIGRDPKLAAKGGIYVEDRHMSRLHAVVDLHRRVVACHSKTTGIEVETRAGPSTPL